jgi:hypothetical protein
MTIWDYYDNKNYAKIAERNLDEVLDQIIVYKSVAKSNMIKNLPQKYSTNSINKILDGLKTNQDKNFIKKYYILSTEEDDRFCLIDEINDDIKYNLIKLINKSGYFKKNRGRG